jgi:dCMP deaminase
LEDALTKWDRRFIDKARLYASWSKDPSTKCGCVIVDRHANIEVAGGFNGFPRSVHEVTDTGELDMGRWARPTKYLFAEHAERNAIYNAARMGRSTQGCWLYFSWNPEESICADCARAIIQAGIYAIVGPSGTVQGREDIEDDGGWRESCRTGLIMLHEAGVNITVVPDVRPEPGPQMRFMFDDE